jgi:type I restriction enzyme R subunit
MKQEKKFILTEPEFDILNMNSHHPLQREPREKVYVNGVDVSVLISRELHFDQHGRPITTSLKDHTKEIIKGAV